MYVLVYLMIVMTMLSRLIPAKASDLWRDAFAANIDSLHIGPTTTSLKTN